MRDLLPLLGYIVFGIANIVFFSMAIKDIPMSTAVAVWMGTALVGLKLIDVFIFKQGYSFYEVLFCALILVGVIGLKTVKVQ
jgi:quaternary ammonium compound-resistance protein SugE